MRLLTWLGIALVGQAAGFLPVHKMFEDFWFNWSLALGVLGLILIIFSKKTGGIFEDDGLAPSRSSDAFGAQTLNLLDRVDHD
jgi:hypothetical protein